MFASATTNLLIWLLALGLPGVLVTLCLFRKPLSPMQWVLYYYNQFNVRVLWRTQLPRRLPLDPEQGAVIICNHHSSVDACVIQAAADKRIVHWMVAQIYGQNTLIGWLLKVAETIPVRRAGRDVSPTKKAIRLAAAGELVGVLPEGRINTTDKFMLPVRPGAVLIALKARVPILPCYIEGSPFHATLWRPLLMRGRIRFRVGNLIDLSEYYGREREDGLVHELTIKCVHAIAQLAGQDDFQAVVAGRDWGESLP